MIPTINSMEDLHGIEIEASKFVVGVHHIAQKAGAEFLKTYLQINVLCALAHCSLFYIITKLIP